MKPQCADAVFLSSSPSSTPLVLRLVFGKQNRTSFLARSRSIVSQRLDDRSSHNGRRRSSSIGGLSRGSLAGAIINDRDNLDISAVAGSLRDGGGAAQVGKSSAVLGAVGGGDVPGAPAGATDRAAKDARHEISNSVQAQIERMFTDVAKEHGSSANVQSFGVRCLGSLPLKEKVTSLVGLQEPLRQLYLSGAGHGTQTGGSLDISPIGLRIRAGSGKEPSVTPFQNIAVWSAVKFVVSGAEGGAAFLPLITDPENIDKSSLFRPLSAADKRRLSSGIHSPLFAIVMRSTTVPRQLECHGFVCQTPEDAIVIAATLYQSLMAHMSGGDNQRPKRPKNRNGVSCMSIASSTVTTNTHLQSGSTKLSSRRSSASQRSMLPPPPRPPRMKRSATSSLSGESDTVAGLHEDESSTEERRKKNLKNKRPPPIPPNPPRASESAASVLLLLLLGQRLMSCVLCSLSPTATVSSRPMLDEIYTDRSHSTGDEHGIAAKEGPYPALTDNSTGDILTRVAIPRSGSFLNTAGLTRYKSRATRRHTGKVGGGGGSPLGFSELFNEFRLQENLHSLDEILNAIINSDGMSFNDLKPIYKEFLLKLAVTLTKDELYQRSKSIMRRQKKKKLKRRNSNVQNQRRKLLIGAKGLRKVFRFGKFRSKKGERSTAGGTGAANGGNGAGGGPGGAGNGRSGGHHGPGAGGGGGGHGTAAAGGGRAHQLADQLSLDLKATGKKDRSRIGTSGSEVSEARHEHTLTAHNRNSSSGYVSCSECSYDSDACTCTSADRCYCSLGGDDINAKLHQASNRSSAPSCRSEDKCYCSMGETPNEDGSTTWCDTDSCISNEKCYCSTRHGQLGKCGTGVGHSKPPGTKGSKVDKLALDYELFTVGGSGRPVKASEALSVKKTVEVAAEFADVKLSQTTDITNLKGDPQSSSATSGGSSLASTTKKSNANHHRGGASGHHHGHNHHHKHHRDQENDQKRSNGGHGGSTSSGIGGASGGGGSNGSLHYHRHHYSTSTKKKSLPGMQLPGGEYQYIHSTQSDLIVRSSKHQELKGAAKRLTKSESYYQAGRPIGSSLGLEDSLGYLP
uniref:PID domain-containing protein n=1 Tax=Anopheles atroparvus TaxID=41427 RepID=A0A182IME2_ANOAO